MTHYSLHLAALAVAAVPNLHVVSTQPPISQTPDFSLTGVLDSNGHTWIVKFPRNSHAGTILEAEAGIASFLLTQLRDGKLPFDILRPAGFAKVKSGRAMVYRKPIGKAHSFADLTLTQAHELGRALAAIQLLSPDVIEHAGMPIYSADACRQRLLAELSDADAQAEIPAVLRRRWRDLLEDFSLWDFTPTVVHGDFADENVLWSENSVSCVLGFGEAHVGDPAFDFGFLISDLSEAHFAALLESYQNALGKSVSESFLQRVALVSEFALLRWLMHGIRNNDSEIIAQAQEMLRTLAADIESDPMRAPDPNWEVDLQDAGFTAEAANDFDFGENALPAEEDQESEISAAR